MGLHVNHNHPDKMNEFLRVYDDNIDETEYNKKWLKKPNTKNMILKMRNVLATNATMMGNVNIDKL